MSDENSWKARTITLILNLPITIFVAVSYFLFDLNKVMVVVFIIFYGFFFVGKVYDLVYQRLSIHDESGFIGKIIFFFYDRL